MGSEIGRPRRFSTKFLHGEREKLSEYRSTTREIQYNMHNRKQHILQQSDFIYQVSIFITVSV